MIITQTNTTTNINQSSQQAILNWNSFNIGANETTHFQQPAGGIALNRIDANQGASQIYGHLSATGQIILINGAGIYFGPSAIVNVGGLIASTSNISDANFLAGNFTFDHASSFGGAVINEGFIRAANYGLVALLGSNVSNSGKVQANLGSIVLGSGNQFTLDFNGDQLINFTIDAASSHVALDQNGNAFTAGVSNTGTLLANRGQILVSASVAQGALDNAINMSGVAQARSVSTQNGEIILSGGDNGTVVVSGTLDTSSKHKNTTGGTIKVLGNTIYLASTAYLNAKGASGGGTILIGGNSGGLGPEKNAANTFVEPGSLIDASATLNGNGGKVVIWSDGAMHFFGNVLAQGGSVSGNGGSVETSGNYLDVSQASINTTALNGITGVWLLDPTNTYIANNQAAATTAGMTTTDASASNVNSGTFAASGTAADSLLTISNLVAALATSNVIVTTSNANASSVGDITLVNPLTWSTPNSLTLSAAHNIILNGNLSYTGSTAVTLTLQANNTGAYASAAAGGTVTNNATINLGSGGSGSSLNVYYNPTNYTAATPTSYTAGSGTTTTAYRYINSLGTATDASSILSLGALSYANNASNASTMWAFNYALSQNIDATATNNGTGWTSAGFSPIGNSSTQFSGKFDGQNFTLNNLYMNRANGLLGLFGKTSTASLIKNLNLTNVNITSSAGNDVGSLVGQNGGTLSNVMSSGSVTVTGSMAGGLIGENDSGAISNAYTTTALKINSPTGLVDFGGLIGFNNSTAGTLLNNVYSSGTLTFSAASTATLANIGGLIGLNTNGTLNGSGASFGICSGSVCATDSIVNTNGATLNNVGGLIGNNTGAISNVSSAVNFSGASYVGGLIGTNTGAISNVASSGSVTGKGNYVGGLIGNNSVAISNASSSSSVTQNGTTNVDTGGLLGLNSGSISGSSSSGTIITSGGNTGGLIGQNNSGAISNSFSTSSLQINSPSGALNFGGLIGFNNSTAGTLLSNIYSSGTLTFSAASTASLANIGGLIGLNTNGTLNGSGASFGICSGSVCATDSIVNTNGATLNNVGGLIGNNTGAISNVSSAVNVSGASSVGGLIGINTAALSNVASSGSVTGKSNNVGGLIGNNSGAISNASSSSSVTQNGTTSIFTGGLLGLNSGSISGSSSSGTIITSGGNTGGLIGQNNSGAITNSFSTSSLQINSPSGAVNFGGLIGFNNSTAGTLLSNIYSSGTLTFSAASTATLSNIGSLIGQNTNGTLNGSGASFGICSGSVCAADSIVNTNGAILNNVGGLIGNNTGAISNVSSAVNVSGASSVGGLIGTNTGALSNVASSGSVTGNGNFAGGLIGFNTGAISNASSSSSVTQNGATSHYAGGLLGANSGSISGSSSSGTIITSGGYTGGLIGQNSGSVSYSFSTSPMQIIASGGTLYGGLIGYNPGTSTISNVYSSGNLTFNLLNNTTLSNIGGLIGENYASLDGSSPSFGICPGSICTTSAIINLNPIAYLNETGGLIGRNYGPSISNISTTQAVSGASDTGGFIGLNSAGSITNASSSGTVTINGSNSGGFVGQNAGGSISNSFTTSPVIINTPDGGHNLGGFIGNDQFSGIISNVYSSGSITINTPNTASLNRIGGLFGYNNSILDASGAAYGICSGSICTTSIITAPNGANLTGIGSVTGVNNGSMSNFTSNVSVQGQDSVGGLVGQNLGLIQNSSSTGAVIGMTSQVGGLVGLNSVV